MLLARLFSRKSRQTIRMAETPIRYFDYSGEFGEICTERAEIRETRMYTIIARGQIW